MGFDQVLVWWFIGVLSVLFGSLVVAAYARTGEKALAEFSRQFLLTRGAGTTEKTARSRIMAVARARSIGAFAGLAVSAFALPMVPDWQTPAVAPLIVLPLTMCGLSVGGVVVTMRESLFRLGDDSIRVARATTPSETDYLPGLVRLSRDAVLLIAALVSTVGLWLASRGSIDNAVFMSVPVIPVLATAVCAWVLARWLTRQVLARPQPASEAQQLKWDDALRADTLLGLAQFVAIVAWVSIVATTYAILIAVQGTDSSWPGTISSLMFTWGSIVVGLGTYYGDAKRHYHWRLWPQDSPFEEAVA